MENLELFQQNCACHSVSRRGFLAVGCAACAAAGWMNVDGTMAAAGPIPVSPPKKGAKKIRLFFVLHSPVQQQPDWPNVGFDFRPVMDHMTAELNAAYDDLEFLPGMVNGPEATNAILAEDRELDGTSDAIAGCVVVQMNCWNHCVQACVATGKPVLYVDFQFGGSGGFLVYTAGMLRADVKNFGFIGSSDFNDVIAAAGCFRTVENSADFGAAVASVRAYRTPMMKIEMVADPVPLETMPIPELIEKVRGMKLLAIGAPMGGELIDPTYSELGIEVISMNYTELNDLWEKADTDEAAKIVRRWKDTARVIADDVPEETLMASAKMTIAMRQMIEKYDARGITVNCLGGFYGLQIQAYPCLGFYELLNSGYIGACECDIRSAVTMIVMTELTNGRPGYISDPIIDTSKRQIVYAHCVASNREYGPDGPSNPFEILTHSEDRNGASVRSIVRCGGMTTTVEFSPDRKEILFHQAVVVENDPDDRACRTKIGAVPLGSIDKLYTQWDRYGWHRVTYFGDLKSQVYALADALGWTICEET